MRFKIRFLLCFFPFFSSFSLSAKRKSREERGPQRGKERETLLMKGKERVADCDVTRYVSGDHPSSYSLLLSWVVLCTCMRHRISPYHSPQPHAQPTRVFCVASQHLVPPLAVIVAEYRPWVQCSGTKYATCSAEAEEGFLAPSILC